MAQMKAYGMQMKECSLISKKYFHRFFLNLYVGLFLCSSELQVLLQQEKKRSKDLIFVIRKQKSRTMQSLMQVMHLFGTGQQGSLKGLCPFLFVFPLANFVK